jgi:DNA-binding response OmpR family regulator
MRVFIVEDERKLQQALRDGLELAGYSVEVAGTGSEAYRLAVAQPFDLVLLDIMLPEQSGLEVLRRLREERKSTPVLILTARDSLEDRVTGLDCGADDYLVKPFAFPELLARMRAVLRRGANDDSAQLVIADLVLDAQRREVRRAGLAIEVTAREFDLLEYLLRHKNHLVSREMLARDVWREPSRATPLDNVIDVHIARLRKKVDQGQSERLIETVRGVGFIVRERAP